MNELKKKGNALPDWIVENFNSTDIVNAIKRNLNPEWIGTGSGVTLDSPTIGKQKYSWSELRRTPKGILAVLAWELGIRKADFQDAENTKLVLENGNYTTLKNSKLNSILLGLNEEE